MSSQIIEICEIAEIKPHPHADKLELAIVKGWQTIVPKDKFKPGQMVIYFPFDTLLPTPWTNIFGVTDYCQKQPENMMRIRQTRLRGEPSFGLVVDANKIVKKYREVGVDVAHYFDAQKYEPPVLGKSGDVLAGCPSTFIRYTDIENMRNFPNIFEEGEDVVVTEKIHGTNVRIGIIDDTWYAGSHKLARKQPIGEEATNWYWLPYTIPGVRSMLEMLSRKCKQVILFGETYGRVQNLTYGIPGKIAFRAFDLYVDGKYLDYDNFRICCLSYNVPIVPLVGMDSYSLKTVAKYSQGNSIVYDGHMREGVVVKPIKERTHPKIGRVCLKYLSDQYLLSKKHDKDTTDN